MEEERSVVVTRLANGVTKEEIFKLFSSYGNVLRVYINGSSAHVIYPNKKKAYAAQKALDGAVLGSAPIQVRLGGNLTKSSRPCRRFIAGTCKLGDHCKYFHANHKLDEAGQIPAVATAIRSYDAKSKHTSSSEEQTIQNSPTTTKLKEPKDATVICRHFSKGKCSLQDECKFLHIQDGKKVKKKKSDIKCTYFANGKCKKGEGCKYSHEETVHAPVINIEPVVSVPKSTKANQKESSQERKCMECEIEDSAEYMCETCTNALYCSSCNDIVHKPKVMAKHIRVQLPPKRKEIERLPPPICYECEKNGSIWTCVNCDNMTFCDDCNVLVHQSKIMSKHKREALIMPEVIKVKCVECESKVAEVECLDCEENLCSACDEALHSFKSMKKHKRIEIGSSTTGTSLKLTISTNSLSKDGRPPPTVYIESVPRYDVSSSESESEMDDKSDDDKDPASSGDDQKEIESSGTNNSSKSKELENASKIEQIKIESSHVQDISSESSDEEMEDLAVGSNTTKISEPLVSNTSITSSYSKSASGSESMDSSDSSSSEDDDESTQPSTQISSIPIPVSSSVPEGSESPTESDSSFEDVKPDILPTKRASTSITTTQKKANPLNSTSSISSTLLVGSSHSLVQKIQSFYDAKRYDEELHLSPTLNSFERKLAHDCAEQLNLQHKSTGEGLDRHLVISFLNALETIQPKRKKSKLLK